MDELIRELQSKAESARALRGMHPADSKMWQRYDGMGHAYDHAASLAYESKRRMADREPAWTLEP